MSDNCCTFAPEIGMDLYLLTSAGKAERATQGCDLQGIAGRKTHAACVRRKREEPYRFRAPLFFVFD